MGVEDRENKYTRRQDAERAAGQGESQKDGGEEKLERALKVCPSSFPVLSPQSSKRANGRSVKSLTLAGGVLRAHICEARAFTSRGPQKTKAFETRPLTPPWPPAPS